MCAAFGIQNFRSSEVTYTVMGLLISTFTHSLFTWPKAVLISSTFHSLIVWLIGAWTNSFKWCASVSEVRQYIGFNKTFPNTLKSKNKAASAWFTPWLLLLKQCLQLWFKVWRILSLEHVFMCLCFSICQMCWWNWCYLRCLSVQCFVIPAISTHLLFYCHVNQSMEDGEEERESDIQNCYRNSLSLFILLKMKSYAKFSKKGKRTHVYRKQCADCWGEGV